MKSWSEFQIVPKIFAYINQTTKMEQENSYKLRADYV